MKVIDKRDKENYIKYSELVLYRIYEYHYGCEPEGVYMKLPDGLVGMEHRHFVSAVSAMGWHGAFVEVECELHIVK